MTKCEEHGEDCAFPVRDESRCPWCHGTWAVILRTGWHSCEQGNVWRGDERAWRLPEAVRMRQEADQRAVSRSDRSGPPEGSANASVRLSGPVGCIHG